MRNVFTHPMVGDTAYHPHFGGGCTFRVVALIDRKGWDGKAVRVYLTMDSGRELKPRRRVYSAATWAEWRFSAVGTPACCTTAHQEPNANE